MQGRAWTCILLALLASAALCLAACVPVTRPTVKIGLVAPFEGRYREVGYEVIYAARLAVREANAAGGLAGYTIELMALDDGGDALAAEAQARKLATDPLVLGVIGHWLDETTSVAAPIYAEAGIPLLATTTGPLPEAAFRLWPTTEDLVAAAAKHEAVLCQERCGLPDVAGWLDEARGADAGATVLGPPLWGQPQFATLAGDLAEGALFVAPAPFPAAAEASFAARYQATSNGVEPRAYAVMAYDATRLLLAAIAESASGDEAPSRAGVAEALTEIRFTGLSGPIEFDAERDWATTEGWVYQWHNGQVERR